jgi:hypothetical protein
VPKVAVRCWPQVTVVHVSNHDAAVLIKGDVARVAITYRAITVPLRQHSLELDQIIRARDGEQALTRALVEVRIR